MKLSRTEVIASIAAVILAIRVGTLLPPLNDRAEPMLSPMAMAILNVVDPQTAIADCDRRQLAALYKEMVGRPKNGGLSSTMYFSAELEQLERETYTDTPAASVSSSASVSRTDTDTPDSHSVASSSRKGDDIDMKDAPYAPSKVISSSLVPSAVLMASSHRKAQAHGQDTRVRMSWEDAGKDSDTSSEYSAVRLRSITGGRGFHPKGSGSGAAYLHSLTPELLQRMRKEELLGIFNRFHSRDEIIGYIELKRVTGMSLDTAQIEVEWH